MVTTDKKGRILKVKMGYNPNSSSMGSMIFILPAALLGVTVIFGAISGVIFSLFLKKTEKNSKKEEKSEKKRNEDE
jgi:membrane protein CcdC involved in cytochrome C biogenesis